MLDALRSLALLGCTAVLLLAVRVTAAPGGGDFDDCGLLVQGPVCVMFQADGGGTYYVEDLTVFQPGDRVRVSGGLFSQPAVCLPPQCTGMYDGCILGNTIEPCVSAVFFCFGDGGDQLGCTDCPCGNTASVGSVGGCLNGAGASGELVAFGEARIGADTLRFEGRDLNPSTFAFLVSGNNALPVNGVCPPGAGIISVFDGLRCVGGNFQRHGARPIDAQGDVGVTTPGWGPPDGPGGGLSGSGGFVAGQTRHFQIFYRDLPTVVCMTGQATSNAARVLFFI